MPFKGWATASYTIQPQTVKPLEMVFQKTERTRIPCIGKTTQGFALSAWMKSLSRSARDFWAMISIKGQTEMTSFVALDLETANAYRGSICQIGITEVMDGKVQNPPKVGW